MHLIVKLFQHKSERLFDKTERNDRQVFFFFVFWILQSPPASVFCSSWVIFRHGQINAKICLSFQFQRSIAQFMEARRNSSETEPKSEREAAKKVEEREEEASRAVRTKL